MNVDVGKLSKIKIKDDKIVYETYGAMKRYN